jgi:hypothetical protein
MKINDNADLLKLKINIKCTNNIAYMDCALLLDKPEFLRLLPEYRMKHGIDELVPYTKFYNWSMDLMDEDSKVISADTSNAQDLTELDLPFMRFEDDAKALCRKFKKPGYFVQIIEFAVVCGVVGDISYQHTKIEVKPTDPPPPPEETELPEVRIVITPMTTLKDVQEVFEKNVPGIFESHMKLLNYYYKMKNRKSGNFRRDREWYWMNIEGIGYTEIALSATSPANRMEYEKKRNRYAIPEYEMVKQAIRRYKNLLK